MSTHDMIATGSKALREALQSEEARAVAQRVGDATLSGHGWGTVLLLALAGAVVAGIYGMGAASRVRGSR